MKQKNKSPPKSKSPSPSKNNNKNSQSKQSPSNSIDKTQKNNKNDKQKQTEPNDSNEETPKIVKINPNDNKSRISPEKKAKLDQDRKLRIKKEKEAEKQDKELFDKIVAETKNNNAKSQTLKIKKIDLDKPTTIKISEKKAQYILEQGGMLDAYKFLITNLCKNGLPTGNLFDYASYVIQSYEKKWKEKQSKEKKEKLEKYWAEKEKELKTRSNSVNKGGPEILNKILNERHMNSYIKSLDRSRSSRTVKQPRITQNTMSANENNITINDIKNKSTIEIQQSDEKKRKKSPRKNYSNTLPPIKDAKNGKSQRQSSNKKLINNKK